MNLTSPAQYHQEMKKTEPAQQVQDPLTPSVCSGQKLVENAVKMKNRSASQIHQYSRK